MLLTIDFVVLHSVEDDIAIMLLEESVVDSVYINDKIWPACLPTEVMNLQTGNMSLASGWGSTRPTNPDDGNIATQVLHECSQLRCSGIHA